LLVDNGSTRLLYTGDCKLGASLTAEAIELPQADILITETTFGRPRYRLPPREVVIAELVGAVRRALDRGQTPVVHAYALGKAQEVSKILTTHGIAVLQHPAIYELSRIYQQCGVDFAGAGGADIASYAGRPLDGHAVVTLPKGMAAYRLANLGDVYSIAATGWAVDESTKYRWNVDLALPLSDHADYDELLELIERVNPREVVCTHGPIEFVDDLRDRGWNARPLVTPAQGRLF
jgi:Cft2 family RNA processing exonuclease